MAAGVPVGGICDWGEAVMTSATGALVLSLGAIPRIIGFVIILLGGWFIADIISKAITALLRRIHFNEIAERSGFSGFINNMGVRCDAAGFLGETRKMVYQTLGFDRYVRRSGLARGIPVPHQLLLWIPNLIVALVVLVIASLAANALASLVRGATAQAGFSNPDFVAGVAQVAVRGFGIIIAVNQIGIASTLVNTLFMGFVGALALALGLAFGLGGRDTAGEIVKEWYQQGRQAAPKSPAPPTSRAPRLAVPHPPAAIESNVT